MKSPDDDNQGADHGVSSPWWRNRQIGFAIFFRAMVIWGVVMVVSLGYWILQEFSRVGGVSWSDVERVIRDSYLGCAVLGLVFGYGFGIPLGIVQILSVRARDLDLEQELGAERNPNESDSPRS